MLQRSQMVAVPLSAMLMGLLTSLPYTRALGWTQALAAGVVMGLLLCLTAGWVAYRSDCGARHFVANAVLYVLAMAPFLGGMNLALAQMAGAAEWIVPAWAVGVVTVLAPVLGPAWQVHGRLTAEGDTGPWARRHVDFRQDMLLPGALTPAASPRPAMTPWQIGALAVNVPLVWRLIGGGDTGLMALALVLLSGALVWVGVRQVGPALGVAWFVLDIERRTGRPLRHPQWADVQAMRRDHWLARWFMRER